MTTDPPRCPKCSTLMVDCPEALYCPNKACDYGFEAAPIRIKEAAKLVKIDSVEEDSFWVDYAKAETYAAAIEALKRLVALIDAERDALLAFTDEPRGRCKTVLTGGGGEVAPGTILYGYCGLAGAPR